MQQNRLFGHFGGAYGMCWCLPRIIHVNEHSVIYVHREPLVEGF